MAATTVRLRAACALAVAGLLVVPALLVLPPLAAAVSSFLVAIAVTLPNPTGLARAGASRSKR